MSLQEYILTMSNIHSTIYKRYHYFPKSKYWSKPEVRDFMTMTLLEYKYGVSEFGQSYDCSSANEITVANMYYHIEVEIQ